jgi:hypothetical protein
MLAEMKECTSQREYFITIIQIGLLKMMAGIEDLQLKKKPVRSVVFTQFLFLIQLFPF